MPELILVANVEDEDLGVCVETLPEVVGIDHLQTFNGVLLRAPGRHPPFEEPTDQEADGGEQVRGLELVTSEAATTKVGAGGTTLSVLPPPAGVVGRGADRTWM